MLRLNNITQIISEFIPSLMSSSSENNDGIRELFSLICSFRYHRVIKHSVELIISKLPSFFVLESNTTTVASTSMQFLQFMSGISPNTFGKFNAVHSQVFLDIGLLEPSALLELISNDTNSTSSRRQSHHHYNQRFYRPSGKGNQYLMRSISENLQSHVEILGTLLNRHSLLVSPKLRAQIDECVLRLLWLYVESIQIITSYPFIPHLILPMRGLKFILISTSKWYFFFRTGHPSESFRSSLRPVLQYTIAALPSIPLSESLSVLLEISLIGLSNVISAALTILFLCLLYSFFLRMPLF